MQTLNLSRDTAKERKHRSSVGLGLGYDVLLKNEHVIAIRPLLVGLSGGRAYPWQLFALVSLQ
jgi:hypothetical protein